jgi:hypothetical protein
MAMTKPSLSQKYTSARTQHGRQRRLLGAGNGQVVSVLDLDPHAGVRAVKVGCWRRQSNAAMTIRGRDSEVNVPSGGCQSSGP